MCIIDPLDVKASLSENTVRQILFLHLQMHLGNLRCSKPEYTDARQQDRSFKFSFQQGLLANRELHILVVLKQLEQVLCLELSREVVDLYDVRELVLSEVDVVTVRVLAHVVVVEPGLLDRLLLSAFLRSQLEER